MCDQIKSYYSNPGRRLQYENWKYRNDSNQIYSNISWNPKHNMDLVSSVSVYNYPLKSHITSKTKPKKTIVSNGFQRKNNDRIILDRKNPQVTSFNNRCQDFGNSILTKDSIRNKCFKIDERDEKFDPSFSNYESDSDTYSSDSIDDALFLDQVEPDNLEELQKFRNEFYFECHSLEAKLKKYFPTKEHICHHQFSINNRLFPEPLYADHLQNSRCQICHLPLVARKDESKSDITDKRIQRSKYSTTFFKNKESDSVNKKSSNKKNYSPEIVLRFPYDKFLSIAIDQKFPTKLINDSSISNKSSSKPTKLYSKTRDTPSDSLALRHQKGFMKK